MNPWKKYDDFISRKCLKNHTSKLLKRDLYLSDPFLSYFTDFKKSDLLIKIDPDFKIPNSLTSVLSKTVIEYSDLLNLIDLIKNIKLNYLRIIQNPDLYDIYISSEYNFGQIGIRYNFKVFFDLWNQVFELENQTDSLELDFYKIDYKIDQSLQDEIPDLFLTYKDFINKEIHFDILEDELKLLNIVDYQIFDNNYRELNLILNNFSDSPSEIRFLLLKNNFDFNSNRIHYHEKIYFNIYQDASDPTFDYTDFMNNNKGIDSIPKFINGSSTKELLSDKEKTKQFIDHISNNIRSKLEGSNFDLLDYLIDFIYTETLCNKKHIFIYYLKSLLSCHKGFESVFEEELEIFLTRILIKIIYFDWINFRIINLEEILSKSGGIIRLNIITIIKKILAGETFEIYKVSGLNQLDFCRIFEILKKYFIEYCIEETPLLNPFWVFERYFKLVNFDKNNLENILTNFNFVENYFVYSILKQFSYKNIQTPIITLYLKETNLKKLFLKKQIFDHFFSVINKDGSTVSNSPSSEKC